MPTRATLFRSNGLQTIRLPEAVAFPETVRDVMIVADGPRRIITPAEAAWDDFFDAPGTAIGDRDQPNALERS
jgi:antitoxin VapB